MSDDHPLRYRLLDVLDFLECADLITSDEWLAAYNALWELPPQELLQTLQRWAKTLAGGKADASHAP